MQVGQVPFLASVFAAALSAATLARTRRNPVHQVFTGITGATCLYFFTNALIAWDILPLWGVSVSLVFLVTALAAVLRFFRLFPERLPPVGLTLFAVETALLSGVLQWALFPRDFFSKLVAQTCFAGLLGIIHWLLKEQLRRAPHAARRGRLRILLITTWVTAALIGLELIPDVPPLGILGVCLYLYFLFQALLHARLLDLKEILRRGTVFAVQAVVLTTVAFLLAAWPAREGPLQFLLFHLGVAASVTILLFEPLHRYTERVTQHLFFRKHEAFERLLQHLRESLPTQVSEDGAVGFTLDQLLRSGRVTLVALYLFEDDASALSLKGARGDIDTLPPVFSEPELLRALLVQKRPAILADLERQRGDRTLRQHQAPLLQLLFSTRAQVAIPLQASSESSSSGVLLLADRGYEEAYSLSEIRLLGTLAGQLAMTLRNLALYRAFVSRNRLLELGEMAAGLAHEIRNPLGAIKGAAQFLQATQPESDSSGNDQRKFLSIIVQEANRLNHVLEEFLAFARVERPKIGHADLPSLIDHTLQLIRAEAPRNLRIDCIIAPDLPALPLDAEQMKQVLLNLFKNAVEAAGDGGQIRVEVKRLSSGQVELTLADSGPGIAESDLRRVFTPFFTTKDRGSGLGLPICQRIVSDHGGEIQVEGQGPLGGASVRIKLPSSPGASDPEDL